MKKLSFLLAVAMLLSFASHAASIYRELRALNGNPLPGTPGMSTVCMVDISNYPSPIVALEMTESYNNKMTNITTLYIKFDADASSDPPPTWVIATNMISTTSYSHFAIGNNHLYIKKTGPDSYTYYCVYI